MESRPAAFRRSVLYIGFELIIAAFWVWLAIATLRSGDPYIATFQALLAVFFVIEATWACLTPYVIVDSSSLSVRDRLLWRADRYELASIESVYRPSARKIVLGRANDSATSISLGQLSEKHRAALFGVLRERLQHHA